MRGDEAHGRSARTTAASYFAGGVACCFCASGRMSTKCFVDFSFYRFLTGLGVGGVFGLSVALVADSIPDHTRAPALGLLQSLSTWGNIAAGLIGMGIGAMAA